MPNWDFVFSFDMSAANWLAERNLPHPEVRPGNRLPCAAEVTSAWRSHDIDDAIRIDDFDWDDHASIPKDAFKIRGHRLIALRILAELCRTCGQLWMYPDTGEPAIIVDASLDPDIAYKTHLEANAVEDSWEYFFQRMYCEASPFPS